MPPMTSRERFQRIYEHKEADRIPILDAPWGSTIERWEREGMPAGMSYVDYFDLDYTGYIGVDNSPRYPSKVLEETEKYTVSTTPWGVTLRNWRHAGSVPEFLDFTITDRDSWELAKLRMTPDRDRVDWEALKTNYPKWRKDGAWIIGGFWFGFDITHSWVVGTERLLMALLTDPEWCVDMFNTHLDLNIALNEMILAEGYEMDCIYWPDDMGFKGNQFFSIDMYRELLKPVHKKAVDWAHSKGIRAHLHSCGNVNPFIEDLIEIGVDALNPLEVKAGMRPLEIKRKYGDRLVLHGGVNAVLWNDLEAITAEMKGVIPTLKQNGGYIFASDHSIPDSVSLENFRHIIELAKELGTY